MSDWFITTELDAKYDNASLFAAIDVLCSGPGSLQLALRELSQNGGRTIYAYTAELDAFTDRVEISLPVSCPRKWTA